MWEGKERSRVLGAPGSNNYGGLIANSTLGKIGSEGRKVQTLSQEDANDLRERYRPLALKIAGQYRNRGIELDELRAAGLLGLVKATKSFDRDRGIAFGSYAQHWIKGEILELFKPKADAIGLGRAESLNAPTFSREDSDGNTKLDIVIDKSPPAATLDVSSLRTRERAIFKARLGGETLENLGARFKISRERVRQINEGAIQKVGSTSGNVARACIRGLIYRHRRRHEWLPWETAVTVTKKQKERYWYRGFFNLIRSDGALSEIKLIVRLSGAQEEMHLQCLKNAETTDWSRRTYGHAKRFKVDGLISWKELTPSEIERAKQKTPDEHLHKFLTHHQLQRFRFEMRAKLCGGVKISGPRKGAWCRAAPVSRSKPDAQGVVIRFPVERRGRSKDFRDRKPPKHTYREPEASQEIVDHRVRLPRLAASRGGKPIRNARGPYGGPIIHQWGQP